MNKFRIITSFVLLLCFYSIAFSQERLEKFALEDVIRISKEQSLAALIARNKFQGSYWQYKSYRATHLPSLVFTGTLPNLNHSIQKTSSIDSTGRVKYEFGESSSISSFANLSLNQNIGLTGGVISVFSELQRIDQLGRNGSIQYISSPVSISISQPLMGFNSFRWERKIQPLLYKEAEKSYLKDIEQVSIQAINVFFDLALAKLNLNIAQINYTNADTLYKISKGRYNIGTIAQNDLLQMELSLLNAQTDLNMAKVNLESQKSRLRSFLGYNDKLDFDLVLPEDIPSLELNFEKVFELTMKNNPEVIARERQLIEAQKNVAQAKGQQRGRSVSLIASYGQSQQSDNIHSAYYNPTNQQQVQLSIVIPIIDWGQGKGKIRIAESNQEVINSQVKQAQIDFEQNIFLQVMQFNLQHEQVKTALKADTIAQLRYDVTKHRFIIGKIAILDLNVAQSEKDQAKRGYINALRNYWNYYYTIRQLTLFDFVKNQQLSEDYKKIVF